MSLVPNPNASQVSDTESADIQRRSAITFHHDKLSSLQMILELLSRHECFDEEDKRWVREEIDACSSTLATLTSFEAQVQVLRTLLEQRMSALSVIAERTDMAKYSHELFLKFSTKQVELTRMIPHTSSA